MKVLVIEGSGEMHYLLRKLFTTLNITATIGATLHEAVGYVGRERFDWIVLDYRLSDGIGTDFVRVVRSGDCRLLLFAEEAASAAVREEAASLGIEHCFIKPGETCQLVSYIADSAIVGGGIA